MSAPKQPWVASPCPYGPANAPTAPTPRHSTGDAVATALVFFIAVAAGAASLFWSLFFAMAADACDVQCNEALIGWAYLITWGGIAVAAIVAVVGVIVAFRRGRRMWVWPTLGLAIIIAAVFIGTLTADSVYPHS